MTLKQFGYLCVGAILAFTAYNLPLPFIVTWPLTIVFAFLGIGFAFIPVEERPMDVWVFSFFKSIYSPTQYLWSREPAANLPQQPAKQPVPEPVTRPPAPSPARPQATAPQQPAAPLPPPPAKAALTGLFQQNPSVKPPALDVAAGHKQSLWDSFLSWLSPAPKPAAQPTTPPMAPQPIVTPSVTGMHPPRENENSENPSAPATENPAVQQKIMLLEESLAKLQEQLAAKAVVEERVLELQKQLTDLLAQKSKTEEELTHLKRQLASVQPAQPDTSAHTAEPAPPKQGAVRVITTQEGAVKAGLPRLTNVPNVITGIVKDDAGNLLPGILVTVTNTEGVPLRALKTNKLGQFGASTPLSSGTYFVEIEDPRGRFTFSRVQITLNGMVVPVLEILAKSEKVLTREKLAQEIFGNTTP